MKAVDTGGVMKTGMVLSFLLAAFAFTVTSRAVADPFEIDGTQVIGWPGAVQFHGPCGITMNRPDDPFYWDPPVSVQFQDPNTIDPARLCGFAAFPTRNLFNSVNPKFANMPDGAPLPPTTTVAGGGVNKPQDPLNAPTTVVALSPSGTVEFVISMLFRDDTDTKFEGRMDAVLEVPYDTRVCPNVAASSADPTTGMTPASGLLPATCILTTPTQYLDALKQGHAVAWAQVTNGSVTAFGPNDHTPQADAADNNLPPDDPFNMTRQVRGGFGGGFVHLPFQTNNNSTVLRIGLRYAIGFEGQMPLAWGGWPAPPCHELNCLAPAMWGGMQTAWAFSQPFVLQIVPARFVQFRFLPTNILYQPPGNESTASFAFQQSYSQGFEVDQASGITDQLQYD